MSTSSQVKWAVGWAVGWGAYSWIIQQASPPKENSIGIRMRAISEKQITPFPKNFQTQKKPFSFSAMPPPQKSIFQSAKR